jgi:hypothetical protein
MTHRMNSTPSAMPTRLTQVPDGGTVLTRYCLSCLHGGRQQPQQTMAQHYRSQLACSQTRMRCMQTAISLGWAHQVGCLLLSIRSPGGVVRIGVVILRVRLFVGGARCAVLVPADRLLWQLVQWYTSAIVLVVHL